MIRFLIRRAAFAVVLVIAVSSAALLLTRLAPGDLTAQLGPFAAADEVARTRERFDLDGTAARQWIVWAGRALRFDFGESFLYGRPVSALTATAAGNTAILGLTALVVATAMGVPFGVITGTRRGLWPGLIRAVSLTCLSLPPLLMSLLFVFAASRTGWLPTGGMTAAVSVDLSWSAWLADVAWHLPVPALALALPIAATLERLQAQAIAEAVQQPYILAASARGVSPSRLVAAHAWRNSLRPLSAVYGLAIGALLSGSFAVEFVTAWPGLGRLMYEALRARDIYLVAGCAAAGGAFLALGGVLADVLLAVADPRVRTERAE